jgi:hypothetical protein
MRPICFLEETGFLKETINYRSGLHDPKEELFNFAL